MNVVKIVVDELPENCNQCRFVKQMSMYNVILQPYCTVVENELTIDGNGSRPSWCPLQLDEVCEWVLDYRIDYAMWDIAPSCCVGEFSINKPNYETCPSCGKRINYVEVE